MPDLNRIRICNVKYNDGNNYYDDFLIKLGGKNTYIDLINGVGKTFCMQCINQPVLPNSKFDEKKSINVLFNKLNKNKVFHSVMEFRLDYGSAYKYAMVGICAYAKDNDDREIDEELNKSNKRFDMFKYICLYNEPNEFDIESFPFSRTDEDGSKRFISKNALERMLKDLQNKDDMDYAVIINETNRQHYDELAKLNINKNEFEQMIEINKFEGNSANYIKPFQKGKDFILTSLIPIIENSYQLRNADDFETSEARANTLITLRKTLSELQKKESLRDKYEYVQNELVNIVPKISQLLDSYREKEKSILTLSKYNKIISYKKSLNEQNGKKVLDDIANANKVLDNKNHEAQELNKQKDAYQIKEQKIKFEALNKEYDEALKRCKDKEKAINEVEDKKLRYECEKLYRNYLSLKEKVKIKEEEISTLTKDNETILEDYNYWGCYYKKVLGDEVKSKNELYKLEKEKLDKLTQNKFSLGKEISALETDIKNLEASDKTKTESLSKLDGEIKDIKKGIYHLLKDDILKELETKNNFVIEKQQEEADAKEAMAKSNVTITSSENDIKMYEQDIENKNLRLKEISKEIDKYNNELVNYDLIRGKYNCKDEAVSQYLNSIINTVKEKIRAAKTKTSELSINIKDLENEIAVSLSDSAKYQFSIISASYPSAVLGSSFLENKTLEERKALFEITELIPFGIIVDKYDFNKIVNDIALRRKFKDEVVPIINADALNALNGSGKIVTENLAFTVRDKECFVDPEFNARRLANLKKELEALNIENERLNNELKGIENDYNSSIKFEIKYNQNEIKEKEKLKKRLEREISKSSEAVQKIKADIENIKKEIEGHEAKLSEVKNFITYLSNDIKVLNEELADYEALDKLSKERAALETEIKENAISLNDFKVELLQKQNEAEEIDKFIPEISSRAEGLNKEFIEIDKENRELAFAPIREVTDFKEELALSEIKSNFQLYKKNAEGSTSNLNALQQAILDLKQSSEDIIGELARKNKSKKGIKYTIEYFACVELFDGDYNSYLEQLEKAVNDGKIELKKLIDAERTLKTEIDKLEGSINNMLNTFKAKYNGLSYEQMRLPEINIKERLDKIDLALNSIRAEIDRINLSIKEFYRLKNELDQEIKILMSYEVTINRVADKNNITMYNVEVQDYNQSLNGINAVEAEIYTALSQADAAKRNYEAALDIVISNLEDSDLVHFKEDLENLRQNTPSMLEECEFIIDKLQGDNGYIKSLEEEKQRISSIINELKEDEEVFINQLLQKCEQVYVELLNLTHLSKININGKPRSMLEVIVRPADEDIRKARMKAYINHLVEGLGDIEEPDRLSYLANNLTLKDLFVQFVDNINNCDVKIYKVDAVESNSKAISWAEVIGSTGQSNGMAYNIFICLISFIKKLYNPHISDESRKFVMFDAPFSGMSASYIWEPIIKLLDENNFQVLCFGYNMPSNLLPLFDVKYYLGTEVDISGNQTVVVKKLKSEVDLEEMSYKKLVGEQISMVE